MKGDTAHKPATLKDVAPLANVSRATAARALNSYGYVGDETAQKVQAAAEKLGYRGNRLGGETAFARRQDVSVSVRAKDVYVFDAAGDSISCAIQ